MTADQASRSRALVDKLLAEYKAGTKGMSADTDRIRSIIIEDPDLVAGVFPALLQWNREHSSGVWGLLYVVAVLYEREYQDDSLSILLNTAAREANVTLPSVLSYTPHKESVEPKVNMLQMAEADVRAGDAHRVLTVMSIETMSTEVRERVIGNCTITFPVDNDSRPIQRIPEVRRFVADLHRRMRYFPMYLNFDRKYRMHLVYFGCLADEAATQVQGDNVGLNMLDCSLIARMKESLEAIRNTCNRQGLDWKPLVRGMLAIFDVNMRRTLFGRDWDV